MPETTDRPAPRRSASRRPAPRRREDHAGGAGSLLDDPERHPLRPGGAVCELGRVVVLAPHPDDESLGCGGLLALLADAGRPAHVVVVTDGTKSHDSPTWPPSRLRTLRETEAQQAVGHLGHERRVEFLRHPDCGLPAEGTPAFEAAADRLQALLADLRPDTLVVPWRRDPHCDHVATWALARARRDPAVRWLEYPVWAWTDADAAPLAHEAAAWRLDVSSVLDRKRRAVAAHRSQTTHLIDDDPNGFVLRPDVLAHFERPWELFLDPTE
ncbi:PIG-L deacetylase family protein [Rubrivirga sp. S365]|uniref:PIG-L deacetylase family protein n=1 Tax=Rubrivirga litoralis TaxID=3075598 RepID=A0ABU3BQN0_9BACT|nr:MULTISPECIES: PIG-L deacetylase family protein [unclassified Rubrivirga]MDT0631491.1 PIG-L deacetylase family protein [Rubrivirga sp. F394]MDT7855526.1 PIG-L deacetylase family protein [Rubrivirga sp. S365]